MKEKSILAVLLLALILPSCSKSEQETEEKNPVQACYYYSQGEKIFLTEVPGMMVLLGDSADIPSIGAPNHIVSAGIYYNSRGARYWMTVGLAEGETRWENSYPLYKEVKGGETLVVLDRIIAKVYPQCMHDAFVSFLNANQASTQESMTPQIYVIETPDVNTTFKVANTLYENKWAEWTTPDFVSRIVLH